MLRFRPCPPDWDEGAVAALGEAAAARAATSGTPVQLPAPLLMAVAAREFSIDQALRLVSDPDTLAVLSLIGREEGCGFEKSYTYEPDGTSHHGRPLA